MAQVQVKVTKLDLQALAREVAEFGGLKPSQAGGLALFFGMVERAAFFAAVTMARGDYTTDPEDIYRAYRGAVPADTAEAQSGRTATS